MPTHANFIIDKIQKHVDTVFGVPGDYVLNFYDQMSRKMRVITTTDEQSAGFAADAYARVRGFGVVCATYCVGGFKLVNAIACAKAEESPVLFISGAPGIKERESGLLLHHAAGPYECQHEIFEKITCASAVLNDPTWSAYEVERVIEAIIHHKQPGYIEIPRDIIDKNVSYDIYAHGTPLTKVVDAEDLAEAVAQATDFIRTAKNPVILAGVEVARFGLGNELIRFAERNSIPVATTLLGKSVVNERHPLSLGVYAGHMSIASVREVIDNSDCVIMLGALQTDMNFGFQPFQKKASNVISANAGRVRVRRSAFDVTFPAFCKSLLASEIRPRRVLNAAPKPSPTFTPVKGARITAQRMFDKINSVLDGSTAIIADVGDSMFGAADLTVHDKNFFLAPAFYTSMGTAVPGALGVQAAFPNIRPIVIVGDGAFQMTGMEFSTIVRHGMSPIIFVLNNHGYSTERCLGLDGTYNDVNGWDYHRIPDLVRGGKGYLVRTEDDLEAAVSAAFSDKKTASIINVEVDKMDVTNALRRMTERLSQHV